MGGHARQPAPLHLLSFYLLLIKNETGTGNSAQAAKGSSLI
jgi:hypothetical protein